MKNVTSQTIGNFTGSKKIESGVLISAGEGALRVLLYSPSVVKISINRNNTFDDFSYAVCAQPESFAFDIKGMKTKSVRAIKKNRFIREQKYQHQNSILIFVF